MGPQGCAAPMTPAEERQKSSAQLALRWLWQRLEQSLIARSSQLLRLGTAILRKRRCTEQLAQRASGISGCAGQSWLCTKNMFRSAIRYAQRTAGCTLLQNGTCSVKFRKAIMLPCAPSK